MFSKYVLVRIDHNTQSPPFFHTLKWFDSIENVTDYVIEDLEERIEDNGHDYFIEIKEPFAKIREKKRELDGKETIKEKEKCTSDILNLINSFQGRMYYHFLDKVVSSAPIICARDQGNNKSVTEYYSTTNEKEDAEIADIAKTAKKPLHQQMREIFNDNKDIFDNEYTHYGNMKRSGDY